MGMPVVAFDTLKFANRLKLVGVDPKQAEAEAEIFSEIFELNLRELVTKEDLKRLEERMDAKFAGIDVKFAGIDAKFAGIDAKIEAKIEKTKFDLVKWVIGLLVAQSGLLFTILRFFPKTGV